MVLPFALVIAVGCYLFLFQSIYTASCSPYLQHVQATVNASSACELEIDNFDFADFVLTMASAMLTVATAHLLIPFVMKQRVWDPGIALMTTVLTACRVNVNLVSNPGRVSADRPKTHDVASVGLLFCEAPTSATVQSIFHYSHPVLSRPTVPNIDT